MTFDPTARSPRPLTLSVCCLAGAPGPQVRALLEPLQGVADEIVVAADARLQEATLAEYAKVADRLIRVEVVHADHHHEWLRAQCSGEWILRVDADDVVSPRLIAALPELMRDTRVRQYWLPRRWLYPDLDTWLDEPPWWPDFQLRLYRNDCLLHFAADLLHLATVSQPPETYLELPLYHLDLIATSTEQREAKVARYDAIRPGMVAPGGGAMNRRYFLPEYASTLESSAVPDDDYAEIERVLSASPVTSGRLDSPVPIATRAETDLWLEGHPFDPEIYRAEIIPVEKTIRMTPSEERAIHFRVKNLGAVAWPWTNPAIYPGRQVRLSYHWLRENGSVLEYDGLRTWLPRRLEPGDSTVVPLVVRAPKKKGTYVLEVDLVHERWFGCSVRVTVPVARRELFAAKPVSG